MRSHIETVGDVTIIELKGDHLDANTSKRFRREVVVNLPPGGRAILDLKNVRFVDSSGCGAILACIRRLEAENGRHGELKLCNAQRPVRALFEMVRLHHIVSIYNTREEAIRAYDHEAAAPVVAGSV